MAFGPQTVALLHGIAGTCGASQSEDMLRLIARITDWDEVLLAARRHGVTAMLHSRLAQCNAIVPDAISQTLRLEFERNAFHSLANVVELHNLLEQFEQSGIRAMPFKGVCLAAYAYGDISARNAGDLDLLVDESDLQRAAHILKNRDYTLITPVRKDGKPEQDHYYELHFERKRDGMVVELRWRLELTQPRFKTVLGLEWIWPSRTTVSLAGRNVPSLDPIRNLLLLCMHGSKHRWSRLMWVCDVARAVEREPDLDWAAAHKEARRTGLLRPLALGVMLANRIAGTVVPEDALKRFEKISSMRDLAAFLSTHLIREPGRLPAGRVPYNIQILGFRDRASTVISAEFLKPNSQDRDLIALPKGLHALYYIVRPIRILLDRSGR